MEFRPVKPGQRGVYYWLPIDSAPPCTLLADECQTRCLPRTPLRFSKRFETQPWSNDLLESLDRCLACAPMTLGTHSRGKSKILFEMWHSPNWPYSASASRKLTPLHLGGRTAFEIGPEVAAASTRRARLRLASQAQNACIFHNSTVHSSKTIEYLSSLVQAELYAVEHRCEGACQLDGEEGSLGAGKWFGKATDLVKVYSGDILRGHSR
jgi:hypothetical protein